MSTLAHISRAFPVMRRVGVPRRNLAGYGGYLSIGPPRTRIAFSEKITHGVMLAVGIMLYPMWVLSDLRAAKIAKWAEEANEH